MNRFEILDRVHSLLCDVTYYNKIDTNDIDEYTLLHEILIAIETVEENKKGKKCNLKIVKP